MQVATAPSANRFLNSLSPEQLSLLEPHLSTIDMHAGDSLQRSGEEVQHLVFPQSGLVAMTLPASRSTKGDFALIGHEGIVGGFVSMCAGPAPSAAEVRVGGIGFQIATQPFQHALTNSEGLRRQLSRFNSALLAQIQQSALCNAAHGVDARLCRWLLEASDRLGERLPLTQEALAQLLRVRRTTVTLAVSKLQKAEVVQCRRGSILIIDRPALAEYACQCYCHLQKYAGSLGIYRQTASLRSTKATDLLPFHCPTTNRIVRATVGTDARGLTGMWRETIVIDCPHCRKQHTTKVSEAYIAHALSEESLRGPNGSGVAAGRSGAGLLTVVCP